MSAARSIPLLSLLAPVAGFATGDAPATQAPAPPGVEALAHQAQQLKAQPRFDVQKLQVPSHSDPERVKALAATARQRSDEQFSVLQQTRAQAAATAGEVLPEEMNRPGDARAPVAGRVVVALSSSMPEQMLHDYMVQLDGKPEAIVVLRGFVEGAKTVGPTALLIEGIRRKVASDRRKGHLMVDVVVDPLIYQSLHIDKVPAVVWLGGVQDLRHCEQETFEASVVAYGAISVDAALHEIRRAGGDVPEAVIDRFEGKPW